MTLIRSVAVALGLVGGAVGTAVLTPAVVYAQAAPKLSADVARPLKAAQDAMGKKQWDTALEKIKEAQGKAKTKEETYQIDSFLGYVLIQQRKYKEAAPVFERMLNSGMMPAEEVDDREKTVAQLYFQVKEYRKAAEWAQKWLKKNPGNQEMAVLLGQAHYLLDDFNSATAVMNDVIARAERAGRTPEENWIQIVLSSQYKLDNREGVSKALAKMVRHHAKPEYWENLLDIEQRKDNTDRVNLALYRLAYDVGVLKRSGDFVEMSQLANDAGLPGDAQQIVQKGIESGALNMNEKLDKERHERLLNSFKQRAEKDKAELPQLAKEAEKASKGQVNVALGQAYVSYGRVEDGIAEIQKGLEKGGVTDPDEARMSLGMAYLKKGQPAQARQAFDSVTADSKWSGVAELWKLRTYSNGT